MKTKYKLWIAGAIIAAGIGIFAIHKTKKLQVIWHSEDFELGEFMCQNCSG